MSGTTRVAVAEYISGNVTSFVDRMNAKAKEQDLPRPISLTRSIRRQQGVRRTHGSVRSYVRMHPEALPYHAIKEFAYTAPGESEKDPQFNRNRLLWSYPGTYGLKTGFTTLAGFNMIALAERSGLDLVAIVLGSARGYSIDAGERERTDISSRS